ncbi:MAG: CBS domain-containing protein [Planctomycetaceae bacterium]|nr:CBS domain-containing protein [Planctomycetaceae bacterium]
MQRVRDLMTHTVWTIESTATIRDAARLMAEKDVGFLPVVHERVSAGVITDRDIVTRVIAQEGNPDTTYVGNVVPAESQQGDDRRNEMNTSIATLPEETPVNEAIEYMDERQVRRMTVHDKEYRIIGVLSRADLPDLDAGAHNT